MDRLPSRHSEFDYQDFGFSVCVEGVTASFSGKTSWKLGAEWRAGAQELFLPLEPGLLPFESFLSLNCGTWCLLDE